MGRIVQHCKMRGHQVSIFLLLALSKGLATTQLPRFQAYWESQLSYLYNDDELSNPWHIDLGNIDVGPLGYLGGPSVVTIDSADYCISSCQEHWPDEFCIKYPPEGVPNRPMHVDDWGVKYNITANMITEGVRSIHERGGKVMLAYGGTLIRTGITAMGGYGGGYFTGENQLYASQLAERISRNIEDWDLDGVDFFFTGNEEPNWAEAPGFSVAYHMYVIRQVRALVGPSKTISYSTIHQPISTYFSHEVAVIASSHAYLDFINLGGYSVDNVLSYEAIAQIEMFGVPLNKVGLVMNIDHGVPELDEVQKIASQVKELGLSGINLFSINKENEKFRGEFARMVAEALYL